MGVESLVFLPCEGRITAIKAEATDLSFDRVETGRGREARGPRSDVAPMIWIVMSSRLASIRSADGVRAFE